MFDEFAELVIALIYTEYRNVKFPLDFHMGNFETLGMYFLVYFLKRSRRQFFSVVFFLNRKMCPKPSPTTLFTLSLYHAISHKITKIGFLDEFCGNIFLFKKRVVPSFVIFEYI